MDELYPVYATAAVIGLYFLVHVATGKFDPFAPVWLFLVGFVQVYVIQALSLHDWAVGVRGKDLVAAANLRALWALLWFLAIYHFGPGRLAAPLLPRPPLGWPVKLVAVLSPILILWGLICAGILIRGGTSSTQPISPEESLFLAFPFVMMVAAVLLIVTGRTIAAPRPIFLLVGLAVAVLYVLIWMFNGKRSYSLIGVLATVCAFYISRLERPSWPVLIGTSFTGALVVAVAIGWRNSPDHERSAAGFLSFLGDFKVSTILVSLNVAAGETDPDILTHETVEYGGFLLMMDTVPEKSGYDHGANYLRVFSTFIPRMVWPTKPIYGRRQWIDAWIAGSEMEREEDFAGPAISILGATQLNGGARATLFVLACVAVLLRTAYDYFRRHQDVVWTQFFWAITYFNAWFMVVTDDPLVWFYYNWGLTTFPIVVFLWWASRWTAPSSRHGAPHELASG
jgi:hypothetical protein